MDEEQATRWIAEVGRDGEVKETINYCWRWIIAVVFYSLAHSIHYIAPVF
jgi:hypothetical protein